MRRFLAAAAAAAVCVPLWAVQAQKVSDLPVATLPLAGDELGVVVQDGITKQITAGPPAFYDIRQFGLTSNPVTFYVAITGSDTNNFCVIQATPCRSLARAALMANKFDLAGGHAIVSIGAGTWTESISQNEALRGSGNNAPNPLNLTILGPSVLLFKGAGAGSTIWDGGGSYCYTAQASNGGKIGIQNLTIRSTGTVCQLSLATQQAGQAFSYGGVEWGASNNQHMHCEDVGSAIYLMGADTLTAGSTNFMGFSGGCEIFIFGYSLAWSVSVSPGLTFTDFVRGDNNGTLVDNNSAAGHFGGAASITGRAMQLTGNAVFANQTGIGFASLFPTETVASILRSGARINPSPSSMIATASTGIGTTGTTAIISQGPRSGFVTLTPGGSGIGAAGAFVVSQGIGLVSDGGSVAVCNASGNNGITGAWGVGATFMANTPSVAGGLYSFVINWANNTVNLTTGLVYTINWQCQEG